ncbi:stress response protein nst1-like [Triticum dicoccoides]|uniref:stress response protein nst1-like n=1 Tax=Triticum dicoccoides TaxID=85692 RepID=UPI000E7C4C1E|nr:stress response protein nst1-like [Triticum dicoccoides]
MCILCAVQRWSRRVATMLPWLVLPLILLWALSQLLPTAYRFEVTSPRLACVSVLLLTLFWYEILLPRLSLWRARRSARLREERRAHALELQKLRKTATRRCRNCNNPYRDQNPGGGKFMCSYCGHVSKRPVLDLGPAGKVPTGWPCSQDWANAVGDPGYWLDLRCSADNSYSGFSWRLFSTFYVSVAWFWKKVFRFGSSGDGSGLGRDGKMLTKGDNAGKAEESRVDKAKRKAEEKRLARLEKEMLEEEEKKQREEMAKLVEERRRLRDEKAEAEERSKGATPVGEKDARKEAERKRQERRRKEDKGSSKSNSDCEDIERRVSREGEWKRYFDRRNEPDRRDTGRVGADGYKPHNFEANVQGSKVVQSKTKYFGCMTGGLLSSSRGFSGGSIFGRSTQAPAPQANKVTKPLVTATDQSNTVKRDAQSAAAQAMAKSATTGETRNMWNNSHQPVSPNMQAHPTGPKKSWHQLFSRSTSVSPCPDVTAAAREKKGQPELNGAQISSAQNFLAHYPPLDSNPRLSQSMHITGFSLVNGAPPNTPPSHFPAGHTPFCAEAETAVLEELERFEDPCYDPDAIALLGPVSESLDNFPPDWDNRFTLSGVAKEPHVKPSPIESPLSRSRTVEEKPIKPSHFSISKGPDGSMTPEATDEQGTWQMWSTPLVQDTLGLRGPQMQWLLPNKDQFNHGVSNLNGGTRSPLGAGLHDSDLWLQKSPFQQLPLDTESLFLSHNFPETPAHSELGFGSPNKVARAHPFGPPGPGHPWPKEDLVLNGPQGASQIHSPTGAHAGLFPTNPDTQSVWSFDQKRDSMEPTK